MIISSKFDSLDLKKVIEILHLRIRPNICVADYDKAFERIKDIIKKTPTDYGEIMKDIECSIQKSKKDAEWWYGRPCTWRKCPLNKFGDICTIFSIVISATDITAFKCSDMLEAYWTIFSYCNNNYNRKKMMEIE